MSFSGCLTLIKMKWASTRENLSSGFANNKGADQPAHPRSLISVFVIPVLESIISKLASSEFSIFWRVSVAEHTGLGKTWSEPCRQFSRDVVQM